MPTSLLELFRGADSEAAITGSAVVILIAVLFGSTIVLRKQHQQSSSEEHMASSRKKKDKKQIDTKIRTEKLTLSSSAAPVDVWADRVAKGVAPASLNHKAGAGEAKPFGSSYYYAHNNSNTSGGYKDGLRMEDYTMNGPRLLSKNGSAVPLDAESTALQSANASTQAPDADPRINNETRSPIQQQQMPARTIISISKYLWDDTPTIGTIRIDQVPAPNCELIAWKEVPVVDHTSELKDKGLLVTITTNSDVEYRLHIRALFAPVVDVKTAVAKGNKRLLVKLSKTKRQNWPHPHAKAI